ncbi:hypothetical protein [Nocardia brasiliensis]|uniref:Uncharacterized protein n=1 Tax=Nocardia brasiliensis (strain ATCC 700358 / HUJEG-1) TaxID=1133849 RepID=K0F0J3_NOCB7|nr:hypothetical protein [Nocardia brasiliensis]AFU02904.1 hypothetical protein O3I_024765 [Nocardia brasiliensis ATCC 700358]OCF85983.1 hypothetical protein AW168_32985 [Nocardia brasiliensis]
MSFDTDSPAHRRGRAESAQWAPVALIVGLGMLVAAFDTLDRIPGWGEDYGAVLVYLAFFLWMSIAGRLTWWALDALADHVRKRR